jgi:hypothetical protein
VGDRPAPPEGAAPEVTTQGLVKRLPGGAFTNNDRAAAAAAGAFRRLPVPLASAADDESGVGHRFRAISRFQHAVNHSRGAAGDLPRPGDDGPHPTEGSA